MNKRTPTPHERTAPDAARVAAAELVRRFAFMFELLKRQVWTRSPLVGIFLMPIMRHLSCSERIFARILSLIAEGRLPAERPRAPRIATTTPDAPAVPKPAPLIPRIPLPSIRAFLLRRFKHDAAIHTQALELMFAEPALRETLALSPTLKRRLRPLCRLLGATLPAELAPPRRASRAATRATAVPLGTAKALPSTTSLTSDPRKPRRLSRKARAEILRYPNFNNRPMKLLPPRHRDF